MTTKINVKATPQHAPLAARQADTTQTAIPMNYAGRTRRYYAVRAWVRLGVLVVASAAFAGWVWIGLWALYVAATGQR